MPSPPQTALEPSSAARVWAYLVHPSDSRNAGAAIRAAANHGLAGLKIVREEPFAHDDLLAFSSGALEYVPVEEHRSLDEALTGVSMILGTSRRERDDLTPRWWPLLELPRRFCAEGDIAILFGNERTGLSRAELDRCQALVSIPSQERFPSLNLSHAVACVAYEIARPLERDARGGAPPELPPSPLQLSTVESESFYQRFTEVSTEITYPPGRSPEVFVRRLRHLLRRANPSQAEFGLIAGIFRELQRLYRINSAAEVDEQSGGGAGEAGAGGSNL